jgi:Lrp/AsnC family leucine-responsive transcriptional regulator
MSLDAVDRSILRILQQEGRITNVDLAQRVGLTPGPTLARVNKLEGLGVISRYAAVVDRETLGLPVTAFVSVILKTHNLEASRAFVDAVAAMPEVLECHHIAGEEDYLLKVVAASPGDYEKFVLERLSSVEAVQRVKTTIVLSSPKCTTEVPIL